MRHLRRKGSHANRIHDTSRINEPVERVARAHLLCGVILFHDAVHTAKLGHGHARVSKCLRSPLAFKHKIVVTQCRIAAIVERRQVVDLRERQTVGASRQQPMPWKRRGNQDRSGAHAGRVRGG